MLYMVGTISLQNLQNMNKKLWETRKCPSEKTGEADGKQAYSSSSSVRRYKASGRRQSHFGRCGREAEALQELLLRRPTTHRTPPGGGMWGYLPLPVTSRRAGRPHTSPGPPGAAPSLGAWPRIKLKLSERGYKRSELIHSLFV